MRVHASRVVFPSVLSFSLPVYSLCAVFVCCRCVRHLPVKRYMHGLHTHGPIPYTSSAHSPATKYIRVIAAIVPHSAAVRMVRVRVCVCACVCRTVCICVSHHWMSKVTEFFFSQSTRILITWPKRSVLLRCARIDARIRFVNYLKEFLTIDAFWPPIHVAEGKWFFSVPMCVLYALCYGLRFNTNDFCLSFVVFAYLPYLRFYRHRFMLVAAWNWRENKRESTRWMCFAWQYNMWIFWSAHMICHSTRTIYTYWRTHTFTKRSVFLVVLPVGVQRYTHTRISDYDFRNYQIRHTIFGSHQF